MGNRGRDPFNQNSALSSLRASSPIWVSEESLERTRVLARLASLAQSDREKWSTSKGGPVFSKRFRLDRTDPLSFGPKFPEILVKWIAPIRAPGIGNGCFQSPSFQDHVTKKRRAGDEGTTSRESVTENTHAHTIWAFSLQAPRDQETTGRGDENDLSQAWWLVKKSVHDLIHSPVIFIQTVRLVPWLKTEVVLEMRWKNPLRTLGITVAFSFCNMSCSRLRHKNYK